MQLDSPAPVPVRRLPRPLAVVLVLLLALVATLATAPAALADPPRSVTIEDTTGDLDASPLTERLEDVSFRAPVDLVALTIDVTAYGGSASNDLALNDAVLAYARAEHPDWITSGGAYWRDGLVIVAIDPDNRFLGTYAGEDVKLDDGQYEKIQEEMRPAARNADWNGAIVDGATRYASYLDRPFYLDPVAIVTALVALLVALAGVGGALLRGSRSRAKVTRALPRYDDVMLTYAETELAARTIPADSQYGEPVLRDYEEFTRAAAEATALHDQLPARRGVLWGIGAQSASLASRFAETTARIDAMDDEIVRTNDLLSRSHAWQDAWEAEVQPLRDSLAAVDGAIRQEASLADSPTARDLRTVAAKVRDGIERVTLQLQNGEMTGDAALGELDLMTSALGRAATAHRDAVIAHTARSDREAEIMRHVRYDSPDTRYTTIRGRRRHYYPAGYDYNWSLSPILWLNLWHSQASTDLDAHRHPPSSSSSSSGGFTGYSGGGGGFSGSGSSGRF